MDTSPLRFSRYKRPPAHALAGLPGDSKSAKTGEFPGGVNIGNQVPLTVDEKDYFLDLLFYHVKLHCYVVIELKEGRFKPEYAGKMNFYLSAVDDLLRGAGDQPSIGLILCRQKRHFEVEYALRDLAKPIGVAEWEAQLVEVLPENLKTSLPTPEEIEQEFGGR